MGVFEDKQYESMDWIAKAVEPIDSKLNTILAQMPDEIVIHTYDQWMRYTRSYSGLYMNTVLLPYLTKHILSSEDEALIISKYTVETIGDCLIDLENKVLTGTIKIVKSGELTEEEIQANLGSQGARYLHNGSFTDDKSCIARLHDVAELFGKCEAVFKTRSVYKKQSLLADRLRDILKNKEWNVRSAPLADKIGKWAHDYVDRGNLAAYTNLCKLKVMTHAGDPIYSIKEEV